ncbi:MAG TPA: GNAT family N-acetyltransferase [Candidatus Merdivicinus intestinigallinarum]|nr:GNAT family N-acetyltransferase [Candidatus Merdivicinus intestinigallinarum]
MIHFVEIDETNWRLPLKVSKEQESYVAGSTAILARAYAYRNARSRAFFVYDGETPVGMGLYYDCEPLRAYDFSQLFIDEHFQGKGYGREAARLVLDYMKKDGKYDKVIQCYIQGNEAAKNLYESCGFVEIGRDEDEIILELDLRTYRN